MDKETEKRALKAISLKFKSGNDIPVESARVTSEEWSAVLAAWEACMNSRIAFDTSVVNSAAFARGRASGQQGVEVYEALAVAILMSDYGDRCHAGLFTPSKHVKTPPEFVTWARSVLGNDYDPTCCGPIAQAIKQIAASPQITSPAEKPSDSVQDVKAALDEMGDMDRAKLFAMYCRHCGRKDPRCQCWNDE